MEPEAQSATIKLDPRQVFSPKLTAEQIALLLGVMNEAHFKGSQCDLVAATIRSLQDPILLQAHGGKVQG